MSLLRSIARFRDLSRAERVLLLRATCAVAAVRVVLWVLPYRSTRSLVDRAARPSTRRGRGQDVEALGLAVERAGRLVPAATCLVRALAARVLLARAGRDAELRIGVERSAAGLRAHAWVESDGRVVVGGPHLAGLTRLEP